MWTILLQMSHGLDLRMALFQVDPSLCVLAAESAVGPGQSPQNWRSCCDWGCHKRTYYLVFLMQKGDQ